MLWMQHLLAANLADEQAFIAVIIKDALDKQSRQQSNIPAPVCVFV